MNSDIFPIQAIRVRKLFGLYNYDIPAFGTLSNASILYGDNGVGKSTLLNMLFHLLSAAPDKGHRTALHNIPFHEFEVQLANGGRLIAERINPDLTSPLELYVHLDDEVLAGWVHIPKSKRSEFPETESVIEVIHSAEGSRLVIENPQQRSLLRRSAKEQGDSAYLRALKQLAPTVFLLSADRRLDSDSVPDPSDEVELRHLIHGGASRRIPDLIKSSRQIALSQALSAAHRWISRQAVSSARQGSTNVHSVYANVVQHIVHAPQNARQDVADRDFRHLATRLDAIKERSVQLASYELAAVHPVEELKEGIESGNEEIRQLSANLLLPYIESLEGRLRAAETTYAVVNKFVTIVNGLLRDKVISYKLSQGFTIHNVLDRPLEVDQLSSGEQQLLLLFCYILTGRDSPSVFMIDEPEISLNVKWQRKLVTSLLELTEDSDVQFVLASHSLELISQHRKRVIKLENV